MGRVLGLVLAVALSVGFPAFAGCASPGDGLLTANEAIAAALEREPDASLVGVYGVEGPQLDAASERAAFRDDRLPDGAAGDGRLSSWVVGLLRNGTFGETRVFGDGRVVDEEEEARQFLPPAFEDEDVLVAAPPSQDSPQAARSAQAADCRPALGGPFGPVGYRYAWSLHREAPTNPFRYSEGQEQRVETLGLPQDGRTWTLVRVDMAPGDHPATTVRLDDGGTEDGGDGAGGGRLLSCATTIPVLAVAAYTESLWLDDPPVPDHLPREPLRFPFLVSPEAFRVEAALTVQTCLVPGFRGLLCGEQPRTRLLDASGTALFDGNAWRLVRQDIAGAAPGGWAIEVQRSDDAGRRVYLGAEFVEIRHVGP